MLLKTQDQTVDKWRDYMNKGRNYLYNKKKKKSESIKYEYNFIVKLTF